MSTTVIMIFMYPEIPKLLKSSGVIQATVTTMPRRKISGENEQVHKAIKAVMQKIIKPLNTAPTFTVKIASARITEAST